MKSAKRDPKYSVAILLSPLILCLASYSLIAQDGSRWLLGTGPTYDNYMNTPGINLNITYRVIGQLHVGPDFSALLTKEEKDNGQTVKRKELEYNFNAHYLFETWERVELYPLIGLNISKVTVHPLGMEADKRYITALNLGGGVEVHVEKTRLFFESKYVTQLDKFDVTLGVLIRLKRRK